MFKELQNFPDTTSRIAFSIDEKGEVNKIEMSQLFTKCRFTLLMPNHCHLLYLYGSGCHAKTLNLCDACEKINTMISFLIKLITSVLVF